MIWRRLKNAGGHHVIADAIAPAIIDVSIRSCRSTSFVPGCTCRMVAIFAGSLRIRIAAAPGREKSR
jgi:hypothetical protein